MSVVFYKVLVKFISVWKLLVIQRFTECFAFFARLRSFFTAMVESTDLGFITSGSLIILSRDNYVTKDSLVLVRMVQSFNRCVAFVALQPFVALVPTILFND